MKKTLCDLVPPALIDSERMREIESVLGEAGRLTERHQSLSGCRSRVEFFAEFSRKYEAGRGALVFGANVPPSDADIMIQAKELEGELLSGFSPMVNLLTHRAASKFGGDPDDLVGEAFMGFFQALVHYKGDAKFSTFLQKCLKRRLSRSCSEDRAIRVPQEVRRLTMRVVERMKGSGASFDEALNSEGVSPEKARGVVTAMSRVCSATELDIRESDMATSEDCPVPRGVMKAIEGVEFTALERAALKGFLDSPSDKMGLSKGCAEMVNPETGRPYSRAAVSFAWRQARKKLAVALKEVA